MKPTKIKAVLYARDLPADVFGNRDGRSRAARRTRKLVYMTIATYADPDGTGAYPSLTTLADACGLTERGVSKVILWLEENGFLEIEYKASPRGTNRYTVVMTEEDRALGRIRYLAKNPTPIDPRRIESGHTRRYTRNKPVPGRPGTTPRQTGNGIMSDQEQNDKHPERSGSANRPLDRHDIDRPINRPDKTTVRAFVPAEEGQEERLTPEELKEMNLLAAVCEDKIDIGKFSAAAEAAGLKERLAQYTPLPRPLVLDSPELSEADTASALDVLQEGTWPEVRLVFDYDLVIKLEENFGVAASCRLMDDVCSFTQGPLSRKPLWHDYARILCARVPEKNRPH